MILNVDVDDRRIPVPPTNIQQSTEIDARHGFFGHVILNISWIESHSTNACMIACLCMRQYYNIIIVCIIGCIIQSSMLLDRHNFTDESDAYFDHFIVTIAPHYEETRCGCNTWNRTIPHVSSSANLSARLNFPKYSFCSTKMM